MKLQPLENHQVSYPGRDDTGPLRFALRVVLTGTVTVSACLLLLLAFPEMARAAEQPVTARTTSASTPNGELIPPCKGKIMMPAPPRPPETRAEDLAPPCMGDVMEAPLPVRGETVVEAPVNTVPVSEEPPPACLGVVAPPCGGKPIAPPPPPPCAGVPVMNPARMPVVNDLVAVADKPADFTGRPAELTGQFGRNQQSGEMFIYINRYSEGANSRHVLPIRLHEGKIESSGVRDDGPVKLTGVIKQEMKNGKVEYYLEVTGITPGN